MPRYRIKMLVYNNADTRGVYQPTAPGATRPVTTCFAGCLDAEDAKAKARRLYAVASFRAVELVEEGS